MGRSGSRGGRGLPPGALVAPSYQTPKARETPGVRSRRNTSHRGERPRQPGFLRAPGAEPLVVQHGSRKATRTHGNPCRESLRSGEDGIRTRGWVLPHHRFSKPALSATQPPLRVGMEPVTSLRRPPGGGLAALPGYSGPPPRARLPAPARGAIPQSQMYYTNDLMLNGSQKRTNAGGGACRQPIPCRNYRLSKSFRPNVRTPFFPIAGQFSDGFFFRKSCRGGLSRRPRPTP